MGATEGKGRGSTHHMVTVDVRGAVIGADPRKLGEEMARIVDAPVRAIATRKVSYEQFVADALARIAANFGVEWIDTHAWQDAQPHA